MGLNPIERSARIDAIDILRGFALLGILLLNILGFGLHSAGYFNPLIAIGETETSRLLNLGSWASTSVFFEGAMRCLFSLLFGAGVVLFTRKRKSGTGWPYVRRHVWLLVFGLIDTFILLWHGDILMVYAVAGVLLYPLRNYSARRLLITSTVLMLLTGLINAGLAYGLNHARMTDDVIWTDFENQNNPPEDSYDAELMARGDSYSSAFAWTAGHMVDFFLFVYPAMLLPDALAMMIFGMALFKLDAFHLSWSTRAYVTLAGTGFGVGLITNLWELQLALSSKFDLLSTFPLFIPTYHVGRLGMGCGYLGAVMLLCKLNIFCGLRGALAAVGRLALTNYLMQSLICVVIFTGWGFALVGTFERWQLYPLVVAIWAFQLWFSSWWLSHYRFGPTEWLWRTLTYGHRP